MRKRILASILAVTMVFTMMPATAFADEQNVDNAEAVETTEEVEATETVESTENVESTEVTETVEATEETEENTETEDGIAVQSVEPENGVAPLAESVTFMNDGYPYGTNMTSSSVTLVMDVETTEGALYTYQWQSAPGKYGPYTDIADATASTYTIDAPVTGTWYRCMVNGNASKSVETVYPGQDGRTWTQPYRSWYISNGTMAYMANGTMFDVTGLYTKGTTKYMLNTSYNCYWDMFTSDEKNPDPETQNSAGNGNASLDALRVAFNDSDAYDIIFEADLADNQCAFSYGCDTQLGDSDTSGRYYDKAALQALLKGNTLKQIAMIGSATVAGAQDDEPAFVIAPITSKSMFWIGHYYSRQTYAYNDGDDDTGIQKKETVNGIGDVATLMEGEDSGMTMSWTDVDPGSLVRFRFCVGSVKDTGAINGKVNYTKEKLIDLDANATYEITCDGNTYTLTADSNGEIALSGTDKNSKEYNFIGKTIKITKQGSSEESDIDVAGRPTTPQQPSEMDGGSANTPELVDKIEIVELTENSVSISPVDGQEYAYSTDGENWTTLTEADIDTNGYYKAESLTGSKVYIKTRISATKSKPASAWSDATELTLKQTIKADATGYNSEASYDGKEHQAVTVTPKESGATVTYSLTKDGEYSSEVPKIKDAGTYTIYYRVEKEGCYPSCGSVEVTIKSLPVSVEWTNTEFTYDGTSKIPTVKIVGGLLSGDSCVVSAKVLKYYWDGSYYQIDAEDAGTYTAYASLDNSNYIIEQGQSQNFTINKADRNAPVLIGVAETISGKKDGRIDGLQAYQMEYCKIAIPEDSDSQERYTTVRDANMTFESGTYKVRYSNQNNYNASPSTTVTIDAGRKLVITLPEEQPGYTITSDVQETDWNGTATLTFALGEDSAYNQSADFAVMSNGKKLTADEDNSNTYTIKNIEEDQTITVTGIVDNDQPTGSIQIGDTLQESFLDNITFGTVLEESQHVTLTGNDKTSGVKSVEYYIYTPTDGKDHLSLEDVKKIDSWTEGKEFDIDSDIKCVIYAKITDKSGNVTYISSNGITVDCTAPVISGAETDTVYCTDLELTVDDVTLQSVTYKFGDGQSQPLTAGDDGRYTLPIAELVKNQHDIKDLVVTATDRMGRTSQVTIKAGHEYVEKVVKPTVLDKGYTEYTCKHKACQAESYKDNYMAAIGTAGLVPNDKEALRDIVTQATARLNDSDLTEEEDKSFYEGVKSAAETMLNNISAAEALKKDIDDMKVSEIINPTANDSDKLNDALTKINELLDETNDETPTQSLTEEQKEELEALRGIINDKLDTIAKTADKLDALKKGTSTEPGVDTINNITDIQPTDQDKIETVLAKLEEYKDEYGSNLTQEQESTVETYYEQMLDKLKEAAKKDIDKELESVKNQIEILVSDPTEKENALADAAAAAAAAKADIDTAATRAELIAKRDNGKNELNNITGSLESVKDKVKTDIESAFQQKKAEIEAMSDLTDSQRADAVSKLEQARDNAVENVENGKLKDDIINQIDVAQSQFDAIAEEASRTDLSNARDNAKADIDKKAEAAKTAIDNMADLTEAEKNAAKAAIDAKVNTAKIAIDSITASTQKDSIVSQKEAVSADIEDCETEAAAQNTANIAPNAKKAESAVEKTTEIVNDIKVSATDKPAIVAEIEKELKASGIDNAVVDIDNYQKIPASLHESGKVTGTVEITVGSTTKTVEIVKELPKLSTYVSYESTVASDAPKAEISVDKDTLMTKILGEDVLDALANGSNADITLDVKNKDAEVTVADVAAIDSKLAEGTKVGKYLDISLFLNVVDEDGTTIVENERIHEAETTFTIRITVPDELVPTGNTSRTFQIVRVHDGVAEILDSVYDETEHTLTFKTDRFSTYAVAYTDAASGTDQPKDDQPKTDQPVNNLPLNSSQPAAASNVPAGKHSPKTGDNSTAWPFVIVMFAGLGVLALGRKKAQNIK